MSIKKLLIVNLFCIFAILLSKNAFADNSDTIFVGQKIHLKISGQQEESELIFKTSGAIVESKNNSEIILSYNTEGEYSIMVCERNSANCLGEFSTFEIVVKAKPNPEPQEPEPEPEIPEPEIPEEPIEPENPEIPEEPEEPENAEIEINFPNIFTPNGDGLNDFYHIIYNEKPSNFSIVIFSRVGTKVFSSNNPDFKWNGQNCSPGNYFYQATYKDGNKTKKISGAINLVRDK